jgi:signal transduction histidine kinase
MENLLPQRAKDIIIIALAAAAAAAILYLTIVYNPSGPDNEHVYQSVMESIRNVESTLEKQTEEYRERAETLFRQYQSNTLQHAALNPKEAFIIEQNGVIKSYYGEIYYYKFRAMEVGEWALIIRNEDIYFTRKMADHLFYFRYFCCRENNTLLQRMKFNFPVSELKFFNSSQPNYTNTYNYDDVKKMFFYSHLLEHANHQLILHLKFSRTDITAYFEKNRWIYTYSAVLLLILAGIFYFYKRKLLLARFLWLALPVDLFFLLPLLPIMGKKNLHLNVSIDAANITLHFHSLFQVTIILLFFFLILYFLRDRLKIGIISYLLFNVTLVLCLKMSNKIFQAVNFNYMDFSLDYLSLIIFILLLHLCPLVWVRGMAPDFEKTLKTTSRQKIVRAGIFLFMQTLMVIFLRILFNVPVVHMAVVSVIALTLLFFKRGFLSRAAIIFLLAFSTYQLTAVHSLREKEEYIDNNLKNIFLNQLNYAKFIAREIVHEINEISDFPQFFQEGTSSKLENIWRRTIASRENIASGIFVVSRDNAILNQFANQIPFLELKSQAIFPFWAIEDATAELHGNEVSLAAASINISSGSEYLGRIIVEVLNSPELLLRYRDKVNIFTLDNKINGRDFSYIKLNADNQIVENPSNINLENISGILEHNNQWINFKYMDLTFKGYIFRHSGSAVIIFFPRSTLFKDLSEVIKVFLIFSLFFLLYYANDLKKIDWRSIYYSFSIRVFSFLILISILTAVLFSIFFINFSARMSEQKVMRVVYENGRIAQNTGYNLIKQPGGFSKSHLLAISGILNSDVSVYKYENGSLVEASNYRKIINAEIPTYLHSQIMTLLKEKNQKFVLFEDEKGFYLFYKVYNYIFMVEFSNEWEKNLSEEGYYPHFIITLFFILVIIGFSAAVFFRNKILAPIDGLNKGMAEVEKGNLPTLKSIPSEIEIKSLYMGFNSMTQGIREQKRQISEISRMKTIIRLGRRVAHEVKNPLTPIKLSAEQILKALVDKNPNFEEIIKQSVNYIIDEAEHLKKVSYGFLDLSRLDEVNAEKFDLAALIREEIFNVKQIYSHIDFVFEGIDIDPKGEKITVTLDKIKIKQVLKNLINNSIEGIGEKKGEIRVIVKKQDDRLIIEVLDNGIGMDEIEFERAFEVDYSTKEIGTGLGLFIVKRIVELHKGRIEIQSEKNKGTRVILDLPERV